VPAEPAVRDPHAGDDAGFATLLDKISRERGFGCASYKERCLRRRVAVRMRATGVHTYSTYAELLDQRPAEWERLLDALTINVTRLFRNRETYEALSRIVVPELWQSPAAQIRVWSAGCSSGEEPYSLAVLFHRYAAQRGEQGRAAARVRILGTDIDATSLTAARRGEFEESDFAETPEELRAEYFAPTPPFGVLTAARALVDFRRHDMLGEPPPERGVHLVMCRNVVIYFDRSSQEALFARFHEALAPGGFLVLGKVETLLGAVRSMFAPVDARERIFRKS